MITETPKALNDPCPKLEELNLHDFKEAAHYYLDWGVESPYRAGRLIIELVRRLEVLDSSENS